MIIYQVIMKTAGSEKMEPVDLYFRTYELARAAADRTNKAVGYTLCDVREVEVRG